MKKLYIVLLTLTSFQVHSETWIIPATKIMIRDSSQGWNNCLLFVENFECARKEKHCDPKWTLMREEAVGLKQSLLFDDKTCSISKIVENKKSRVM